MKFAYTFMMLLFLIQLGVLFVDREMYIINPTPEISSCLESAGNTLIDCGEEYGERFVINNKYPELISSLLIVPLVGIGLVVLRHLKTRN